MRDAQLWRRSSPISGSRIGFDSRCFALCIGLHHLPQRYVARKLGCMPDELTQLHAYVPKLQARPAFQKAIQG